jgi:hypothetical protein
MVAIRIADKTRAVVNALSSSSVNVIAYVCCLLQDMYCQFMMTDDLRVVAVCAGRRLITATM